MDETLEISGKTIWKARSSPHLRPRQQGNGRGGPVPHRFRG